MHAYYTDVFVLTLPDGHRFPMAKYSELRLRVAKRLPEVELRVPAAAADDELLWVRHPDYAAVVMGGGYAPDVGDIVDIHFETVRTALRFSVRQPTP